MLMRTYCHYVICKMAASHHEKLCYSSKTCTPGLPLGLDSEAPLMTPNGVFSFLKHLQTPPPCLQTKSNHRPNRILRTTTCQLILMLQSYDPGILLSTHLGSVLGSNLKRN